MTRRSSREDPDREAVEEARREAHEVAEGVAQTGTVARELELRALAVQHRGAYSEFVKNLEKAAAVSRRTGWPSGRRFLRTFAKADAHLAGRMNPVARWYLRQVFRSPQLVERLLDPGLRGDEERARLEDYVEEHGLQEAFESLWQQLGTAEQESRPT